MTTGRTQGHGPDAAVPRRAGADRGTASAAGCTGAGHGPAAGLPVEIADPRAPSRWESDAVREACRHHGLCLYRTDPERADPAALSSLAAALGLVGRDHTLDADEHGVASIHASPARAVEGFIPYSTRALNWHTDGYYLAPPARIRGVLMHCARPAASGGETELLDPRVVYRALIRIDPRFADALSRPDAFTIPAREDAHGEARAAVSGPVFTLECGGRALHMRYTARTRSIEWLPDPQVLEARDALREIIERVRDACVRVRLAAGEGVICNNVLHRRDAYEDARGSATPRLLYRIRSFDRVEAP